MDIPRTTLDMSMSLEIPSTSLFDRMLEFQGDKDDDDIDITHNNKDSDDARATDDIDLMMNEFVDNDINKVSTKNMNVLCATATMSDTDNNEDQLNFPQNLKNEIGGREMDTDVGTELHGESSKYTHSGGNANHHEDGTRMGTFTGIMDLNVNLGMTMDEMVLAHSDVDIEADAEVDVGDDAHNYQTCLLSSENAIDQSKELRLTDTVPDHDVNIYQDETGMDLDTNDGDDDDDRNGCDPNYHDLDQHHAEEGDEQSVSSSSLYSSNSSYVHPPSSLSTRKKTITSTCTITTKNENSNIVAVTQEQRMINQHGKSMEDAASMIREAESYLDNLRMIQVQNAILMDDLFMIGAKF